MLKKIAIVVAVLLAGFAIVVARQPPTFRIERSVSIAAPPFAIYSHVDDFRRWQEWSAWEALDPSMTRTFSAAQATPGATYQWVGNRKVGEGRMTLLSMDPQRSIAIKLEFLKPRQDASTMTMTLVPHGPRTRVVWVMEGQKNFLAKLVCLFVDLDKLVGGDFERGLAQLKQLVESRAPGRPAALLEAAPR